MFVSFLFKYETQEKSSKLASLKKLQAHFLKASLFENCMILLRGKMPLTFHQLEIGDQQVRLLDRRLRSSSFFLSSLK